MQLESSYPRSRCSTLDRLETRRETRRLNDKLGEEVGRRAGLEVAIPGIRGAMRRLDTGESRIFFLCHHDVPRRHLAAFRSGVAALAANSRFLAWDEALSLLSGVRFVPGSHFCLTFDDGDRSWVEVVLPTLALLGNRHIEPGPGHGHGL